MKKITVKPKMAGRHKPGELKRTVIEYGPGADGGASVAHEHEPQPPSKDQPFGSMMDAGPAAATHFTSRAEALHHAAQTAGVDSMMDDEDAEEAAKGKKPSAKEERAEGEKA